MTHIDLICVGKGKERYFADAVAEYRKRLSAYAAVDIFEVKDEATPEDASQGVREKILQTEGGRIRGKLKERAYHVALAIDGTAYSSEEFAAWLSQLQTSGVSRIQFMIGGSLGLEETLQREADARISFSRMTFPHQLMRVILLEQLYRAYRILQGAPYHK